MATPDGDMEKYITDEERKRLSQLRNLAQQARQSIDQSTNPLNMTLQQLIERWVLVHTELIRDIVQWSSSFHSKYGLYFNDVDQTKQWIEGIIAIFNDFIGIILKQDRGIYIGISLILITVWIYFITIAE